MELNRRSLITTGGAATVAIALAGCSGTRGSSSSSDKTNGDFPKHDLTMIAAGSPGGGLDTASRTLKTGFKAADIGPGFKVENIGGGGGNPARAALLKRPNDGHSVVVESDRIYLTPLMGTTKMQVDDFTPLANLTSDYEVWVVKADSKFDSAESILKSVKKKPKSVSFGVGTTPSDDQFNILLPAMKYGVDNIDALNIVAFKEGGDLNTELLGGHVDVASTGLSEAITLAESGKFRLLAVSSPKRSTSAKDVPTWQELGIDVTLPHWRGVFGPADMPQEAVDWWKKSIKKATATNKFTKKTKNLDLSVDYVPGDKFLNDVIKPGRDDAKKIIKKLGIGK